MKKYLSGIKCMSLLILFSLGVFLWSLEVHAAEKLPAPVLVSATSTEYNSVTIQWKKVSGATSYRILYRKTGDSKWLRIRSGVTGTSATLVSSKAFPIVTGTSYEFTVRSIQGKIPGKYNKNGLQVVPTVATVPLLKITYPAYGQQKIHWEKVNGASGYLIYRMEKSKWKKIGKTGKNESSYIYADSEKFPVIDGATYTYTVRAYRKVNGVSYRGGYSQKGIQGTAPAKTDPVFQTGWKTEGSEKYYLKNGEYVSGWKTIEGKKYYFDKISKKLLTNTIAGDEKSGYYYVDTAGIRVTDPTIKQAVAFVRAHTTDTQSGKEKLKACYNYIVNYYTYERAYDKESIDKMPSYAQYFLTNHKGNCYRGAAALTYIAKVLGFETRMGVGGVTAYTGRNLSPHGWNEVKINGKWYASDISMQRYHKDTNLFLVLREKYPYRIRCDKEYYLEVEDGNVIWQRNTFS